MRTSEEIKSLCTTGLSEDINGEFYQLYDPDKLIEEARKDCFIPDLTYPTRNLSLLSELYPSYPLSSQIAGEEYEYMCIVACRLLERQVKTCPDSDKWYFENLVKDYKSAKDIILGHVCKNKPDFANFLKQIKAI